jgi:hypothetical protein
MTEHKLDSLLTQHFTAAKDGDAASIGRVTQRLAAPLPRQKHRLFAEWQAVVFDWQFAPAWPRVTALAACAVFGLFVGLSGIDHGFGRFNSPLFTPSAGDFTSSVFEP